MTTPPFVSTQWLADHLDDPNVAIVEASYYLPSHNRDGDAEFIAAHIPGAVRFDLNKVADHSSDLPHMLPTADEFAAAAGALGISQAQTIVVYDGLGLFSAPRVGWTFSAFGAKDVRILEGGFPRWVKEGRPTGSGEPKPTAKTFQASPVAGAAISMAEVARTLKAGDAQVVDARPAERFRGEVAEPRAGLRKGHIPGSLSLPFGALIEDGAFKSPDELRKVFADAGIALDRPMIASCGSGVTACIVALAAQSLGAPQARIYDGSFAEWGHEQSGMDVATGEAKPAGTS